MKKLKYIVLSVIFASLLSCVEEVGDINSTIVVNDKIDTNNKYFDVQMAPKNIDRVQTDNINFKSSEYLLGYYNPNNYKKINASIISKLVYAGKLKTAQSSTDDKTAYGVEKNIDSTYTLDQVILKIPYADKDNTGKFNIKDILGNADEETTLKVLVNKTFLNNLDPNNPSKKNKYYSDSYSTFEEGEELTIEDFKFTPSEKHSVFEFKRTNTFKNSKFDDFVKITKKESKEASKLFLAIPLDLTKIKSIVWDKLDKPEFNSKEAFNDYFKGIIIKSIGNKGSLLSLTEKPSIELYYTITRVEEGDFKDTLNKTYSIPLGDIQINTFETSTGDGNSPKNNVTVQGTSGNELSLDILNANQIEELKKENILITDATLTFYINKNISKEYKSIPKRLMVYKETQKNGKTFTEHIINSLDNGDLIEKDSKPHQYKIRITNYIKNLIDGKEENTTLKLKVLNYSTDLIVYKKRIDNTFRFYNSNPRGVTLYDGNKANGDSRAQLKISYSKEK